MNHLLFNTANVFILNKNHSKFPYAPQTYALLLNTCNLFHMMYVYRIFRYSPKIEKKKYLQNQKGM